MPLIGIPGAYPRDPIFDIEEIIKSIRVPQTPPEVVYVPKNEYDHYGAKAVQQAAEEMGVVVVPVDICACRFEMPDKAKIEAIIDTDDLPNPRYHNRTFPKHYDKKKKVKRRMQKHSRRR